MLLLCLFVMSFWNDMLILIIVRGGMYWHYTFYKNTESFMFYQL